MSIFRFVSSEYLQAQPHQPFLYQNSGVLEVSEDTYEEVDFVLSHFFVEFRVPLQNNLFWKQKT